MPRILLAALAALLLLAPATAAGSSSAQLRGTVAQKLAGNNLIRVDSPRKAHILRVPGSQARIRVGQGVELRGTTLRQRGNGSRVLAQNVVVVRSMARSTGAASAGKPASSDDNRNSPDDNSGPGRADDDDDDNSGPGNAGDDDTDDDSTDDDTDDTDDDTDDTDDDSTDDD